MGEYNIGYSKAYLRTKEQHHYRNLELRNLGKYKVHANTPLLQRLQLCGYYAMDLQIGHRTMQLETAPPCTQGYPTDSVPVEWYGMGL